MTPVTRPPAAWRGVGQRAHHPDAPAAVDDADAALGERRADRAGGGDEGGVGPGVGPAEDADRAQVRHD